MRKVVGSLVHSFMSDPFGFLYSLITLGTDHLLLTVSLLFSLHSPRSGHEPDGRVQAKGNGAGRRPER